MEADWEVEIGDDAPVIEACWEGLLDLRRAPECAAALPEAKDLPALADALVRVNAPSSPVWTAKCDVWRPDAFDPDELDALQSEENCGIACYIDLLPRDEQEWIDLERAVAFCRGLCATLRAIHLRCCRVDLIVRGAIVAPDRESLGVTAYFTACGAALEEARFTMSSALAVFADTLVASRHPPDRASKLQ